MTDSDRTIDLGAGDPGQPEGESIERRLATIAAETAAGVSGVHHLGGTAARTLDRAARAVLGTSTSPGITVSRADGVTTVDLDLVVEYPHNVRAVIDETREQVARAAAPLIRGSAVVNVTVTDVHGPFDPIEPPDDEREYGEPLVDRARGAASSAAGAAGGALDSVRESAGDALDRARDAIDSARERTADALDSAADAVDSAVDVEREAEEFSEAASAAVDRSSVDRSAADRTIAAEAPAAAEFVVRVEVEPADGEAITVATPVAVEVEPVGDRLAPRAGQE